jgi:ABC-2 type transport system ATP-binding protein
VGEGRTIFLSSHLLDEVEKTCDQVAIVDHGRVILQGAVDEIASSGEPTLLIEVEDLDAARRALATEPRVSKVEDEAPGELRLTLAEGLRAADVNRLLVQAGVGVSRLEPARATLEETFLAVTSRLEAGE